MLSQSVDVALVVIGVAMVLYHMVSTQYLLVGAIEHQNIHLMFALTMVFLAAFKKKTGGQSWLWLFFLAVSLLATGYVALSMEHLINTTGLGICGTRDIIIGFILALLPVVACYIIYGPVLSIVAAVAIGYIFFGPFLPAWIGHGGYTLERIAIKLSIGLDSGVYGTFLGASVAFVFLIIVFGAVLQLTGAVDFFMSVAKIVGNKVKGGAAQSSVVSSAMIGTVSGSPVVNVVMDGVWTIPAMKAAGYPSHVAGAIEATASTGGQIMPPVMGAAAFIMASVIGVPYAKIMLVGFLPAVIYFLGVGIYLYFFAQKHNIGTLREAVDIKELYLRFPLFIIPLGLLTYLLLIGRTVMMGAFWAIVSAFILSLLRKKTRPSISGILNSLADGAKSGSEIAVACSLLGLIAVSLTMTGLALRIPDILVGLAGGQLMPVLIMGFIAGIFLGCGLHTVAVYILLAMTVAPGLIMMGVPVLATHFFILYTGVFSNLTPPVAMACIVASGIAKSKFLPTCWQAMRIGLPGILLPFLFIYCPPLLGVFEPPLFEALLRIISLIVAITSLSAGLTGYLIRSASTVQRGVLFAAAAGFVGFTVAAHYLLFWVSVVLLAGVVAWQLKGKTERKRRDTN